MCRAGLFSKGPEVVAFSEPEASHETGLLRLFVVARGLALRPAIRGGGVDVDPGKTVGLRVHGRADLPVLTLVISYGAPAT